MNGVVSVSRTSLLFSFILLSLLLFPFLSPDFFPEKLLCLVQKHSIADVSQFRYTKLLCNYGIYWKKFGGNANYSFNKKKC